MSQREVTLTLPEAFWITAEKIAKSTNRPVSEVLVEALGLLLDDMPPHIDPDALTAFTDTQLWALVHQRLSAQQSAQLNILIAKAKDETITPEEQAQANQLVAQNDDLMVLRSQALLLLKQRGHDISAYLKTD